MLPFYFVYVLFRCMFKSTLIPKYIENKVWTKQHKVCFYVDIVQIVKFELFIKVRIIYFKMCQFIHYNLPLKIVF